MKKKREFMEIHSKQCLPLSDAHACIDHMCERHKHVRTRVRVYTHAHTCMCIPLFWPLHSMA
jgi:hypothetical protein